MTDKLAGASSSQTMTIQCLPHQRLPRLHPPVRDSSILALLDTAPASPAFARPHSRSLVAPPPEDEFMNEAC